MGCPVHIWAPAAAALLPAARMVRVRLGDRLRLRRRPAAPAPEPAPAPPLRRYAPVDPPRAPRLGTRTEAAR